MITLKDLIVTALAVLGGISVINWIDVPYWVYAVLFATYTISRVSGRTKKIKDIKGDTLLGSK